MGAACSCLPAVRTSPSSALPAGRAARTHTQPICTTGAQETCSVHSCDLILQKNLLAGNPVDMETVFLLGNPRSMGVAVLSQVLSASRHCAPNTSVENCFFDLDRALQVKETLCKDRAGSSSGPKLCATAAHTDTSPKRKLTKHSLNRATARWGSSCKHHRCPLH